MAQLGFGTRLRLAGKALVGLFNESSAHQAFGLLSGLYPGSAGPTSPRGTKQILEGYGTMPHLRAVASKIAQSVAATEWTLWAPTDRKRNRIVQRAALPHRHVLMKELLQDGELERLTSHLLLDALANANDYLIGPALLRTTQIHIDLVGEAFWIKERNGLGAPVAFWPVPPHWVAETPTPGKRFYRVSFSGWRGEVPDTEILWLVDPDPANPYGRGTGTARALADELETDEFAAKHVRQTFVNRARPDLIIWPEAGKNDSGVISETNAQVLAERWNNEHQGFWRAAKPFFATRKLGVHEFGQSFQELQLTDLRKHERDVIVQTFGVPPEILGIVKEGALNRAALDSVDYLYNKSVIVPRLEFLRAYLQERIVPEYDERLIVDYVSPIAEDRQFLLDAAKAAPHTKTVDEWRAIQGHEPLPDGAGQVFMMPANLIPTPTADLVGAGPPGPSLAAYRRGAAKYAEWRVAGEAAADAGDTETEQWARKEFADDTADLPELARRISRQETGARRWIEAQLAGLAESVTLAEVVTALKASDPAEAVVALVDWEAWQAAMGKPAAKLLREAFLVGVQWGAEEARIRLVKAGSIPWNVVNPEALAWAQAHAAELLTNLTAATRAGVIVAVREQVALGLKLGWSGEKTARAIRPLVGLAAQGSEAVTRYAEALAGSEVGTGLSDDKFFARVGRYTEAQRRRRALTIARTELMNAGNAGQQKLWEIAVKRKLLKADRVERVWIITPDEAICPICMALNNATAPLMGPFPDGTLRPPRHVNCRCCTGLRAKKARG